DIMDLQVPGPAAGHHDDQCLWQAGFAPLARIGIAAGEEPAQDDQQWCCPRALRFPFGDPGRTTQAETETAVECPGCRKQRLRQGQMQIPCRRPATAWRGYGCC